MNFVLKKCVGQNAKITHIFAPQIHVKYKRIKLTQLCWDISQTTFSNAVQWKSLRQLKMELKGLIRNYPSFGSEGLGAKQATSHHFQWMMMAYM